MTAVRMDRRGRVALITFDGATVLNAFSRSTWEELDRALQDIADDHGMRAVVLTGAGRSFVAGADIREYDGISVERFTAFQRLVAAVTGRLTAFTKPTIAAVNGYALGGGFELALACDLLLAGPRATFGLPEITLGLLPGGGGTQRLTRIVGPHLAARMLMTGTSITAEEAHQRGIVDRVVDDVVEASITLGGQLASRSAPALAVAKRLVATAMDGPLAEGLEAEITLTAPLIDTSEARDGIASFLRRRETAS